MRLAHGIVRRLPLRTALQEARLAQLLSGAARVRVAVVGDFVLDRYLVTDPRLRETSIETGRPAHQVIASRVSPGHGGTVTSNLTALGVVQTFAVGAVGDDGEGYQLRAALEGGGVNTTNLVVSPSTTTGAYLKTMRLMADGSERERDRLDLRRRSPLDPALEHEVIRRVEILTDPSRAQVGAVIVADQVEERNHGVITDSVRAALCDLAARRTGIIWLADSRRRIGEYRYLALKPNRSECMRAESLAAESQNTDGAAPVSDAAPLLDCARSLASRAERPVFVTRGEEGMLLVEPDGEPTALPAVRVAGPVDPTGAGDATSAGIVVGLAQGASPVEAAALGTLVAGVTVSQLGTTGTATPAQLMESYAALPPERVSM